MKLLLKTASRVHVALVLSAQWAITPICLQLAAFAIDHRAAWKDVEPDHSGLIVVLAAFRDPLMNQLVVPGIFVEQKTADVRHALRGLQQHQALASKTLVEPAARQVVDEGEHRSRGRNREA